MKPRLPAFRLPAFIERWFGGAALLVAACDRGDATRTGDPHDPAGGSAAHGFIDVTEGSGLDFRHVNGAAGEMYFIETNGSGLGFFDYDDDRDLDLLLVQGGALPGYPDPGPFPSRLFRNEGGADTGRLRFTDVTSSAGCGATVYGTGCLLADWDGDGARDLFVYGWGPNFLYRNRGDGTFEDVTRRSGVSDARYAGTALFADFDRDDDLDLFVGNYVRWTLESHRTCAVPPAEKSYCHPDVFDAEPNLLYRNNGNGTFTEVAPRVGITRRDGKALGAVVSDVDDDGDLDLFVANDSTPNFLYRNDSARGQLRFTDISEESAVSYDRDGRTQGSMGCDFADIDGDGDPDLIVTNLALEANALYINEGAGRFDEQAFARGVGRPSVLDFGWGVRFFDYELDGDQDLLVINGHLHAGVAQYDASQEHAQRPKLLLNDGTGCFELAPPEAGTFLAQKVVGRGLAMADLDDDGDLDFAVSMNGQAAKLVVHAGRPTNHWLGLELRQPGMNRDALGARVEVRAGGRTQVQELRGAASFASYQELRLLFGLGAATAVESVVVRWPQGDREEFGTPAIDRYHELARGTGTAAR